MKIFIGDNMIVNTELVSIFKIIPVTRRYNLVAFCGNSPVLIKSSDDLREIQNYLGSIMYHIYIGTEFFELDLNEPITVQPGGITMTDYQKYEQIKQQLSAVKLNPQQYEDILKIVAMVLNI